MKYLLLLCFLPQPAIAQLYVAGTTLRITSNATVLVNGNVTIAPTGTLQHNGTLDLSGNYNNQGTYSYAGASSKLVFRGNSTSTLRTGGYDLYKLENRKTGAAVVLLGEATVVNNLRFFNNFSYMQLDSFNLVLGPAATITGAGSARYVLTNGTGALWKRNCANFTFPVGFNGTSYNPVTILENGVVDPKGVRCLPNALSGGSGGAAFTQGVADVSWLVSEYTPGGSVADLTFSWTTADELTLFDRNNCAVADYNGGVWNSAAGTPAGGGPPYTQTRTGATTLGYFLVGTPGAYLGPGPDVRDAPGFAEPAVDFQLFPNPVQARQAVFIRTPDGESELRCEVTNASGQPLPAAISRQENWLRLDLPGSTVAGTYFIRLWQNGRQTVRKLIVLP